MRAAQGHWPCAVVSRHLRTIVDGRGGGAGGGGGGGRGTGQWTHQIDRGECGTVHLDDSIAERPMLNV